MNGKRTVNLAEFSSPNSSGPSTTSQADNATRDILHDIPVSDHSTFALEFTGVEVQTAQAIWQRWENRPDGERNPHDLIDYAAGHVQGIFPRYTREHLPNERALVRMGLQDDVRRGILQIDFSDCLLRAEPSTYSENTYTRLHDYLSQHDSRLTF